MNTSEILQQFEPKRENLLNILHAIQNNNPQNNLLTDDLIKVANFLNITLSSVYGVVKYYSMFSIKPRGKYVIRVCKSPICNMIGNHEIINEIKALEGISLNESSNDQLFFVEETECLGRCAKAPSIMINDKTFTSVDKVKMTKIIQDIRINEQNKK